jgi:hypothetical protein
MPLLLLARQQTHHPADLDHSFFLLIIAGSCLKTIRSRSCHCNNRQLFEVALETSHRSDGLCVILGLATLLVMLRFSSSTHLGASIFLDVPSKLNAAPLLCDVS